MTDAEFNHLKNPSCFKAYQTFVGTAGAYLREAPRDKNYWPFKV